MFYVRMERLGKAGVEHRYTVSTGATGAVSKPFATALLAEKAMRQLVLIDPKTTNAAKCTALVSVKNDRQRMRDRIPTGAYSRYGEQDNLFDFERLD